MFVFRQGGARIIWGRLWREPFFCEKALPEKKPHFRTKAVFFRKKQSEKKVLTLDFFKRTGTIGEKS